MIDWNRVRDLQSEVGQDDFADIARMFLQEADEAVARLGAEGNGPATEATLHFLKGAALNLGFSTLATLCNDGERHAAAGTRVDLGAVAASYSASKQAFQRGMTETPFA